jgi:hypothetical protein
MELLQEVRAKAEPIARSVYEELLARIGLSLGEAGLLLPDIVDLDRKQNFEQQTIPQLREALAQGHFASLDELLAWLRKEAAAMTPGADPLPALKAPLAYLCDRWVGELGSKPLFTELESWAKQR